MDNQHPVLYTAADLCKILHCGETTAYNLMHSKGFPSFRINNRIYVEKGEFEKWIARMKGQTHFM